MVDARVVELASEIRDLYRRNCAAAAQYNAGVAAEQDEIRTACRARRCDIEELNYFEDVFDRQAAIRTVSADRELRARATVLHAVMFAGLFALSWQAIAVWGASEAVLVLGLLYGGGCAVLHHRLILGSELFRRRLREMIAARGVRICVNCGYDLRGQVEPRCPECGRADSGAAAQAVNGGATHGG